jgi:flagellar biosynthesis/type III secretory pathway M-ring protein FliF/YscJ
VEALLLRWKALASKQRSLVLALTGAAIVAIAFASFLQRDTHVALFAVPLETAQIAEVTERLAEWDVAFVATPDNVRVEAAVKNDLLLKLSLAGIPHARLDSTTDALAKAGPLTPQTVLEAQQRAGLAGDIAAGLRGLAPVEDARVIIAPAEAGTYADEAGHDASASVRLSLRAGATLDRDAAIGIRQYVAAAVPGLVASRVALLDDRGSTLGDDAAANVGGEAASLAASLQSALDLAFGAGATIVRARVSYDPRAREVHEVVRKPIGSRPVAETTTDEHYASPSKKYGKLVGTVDRGSDVQDFKTETPAGRVERLSVAVAVDQNRRLDLGKIRSLAIGTLGMVSSRGDTLSIEEMPFAHSAAAASFPAWALALGSLATLVPSLALAAAFAVGVRYSAAPVGRVLETLGERLTIGRATRAIGASYAPAHVRGALRGEPPHTAAAIISALPAATATAVLDMYPPEERAAIVRRMARAATPAMPDYETVLRRG